MYIKRNLLAIIIAAVCAFSCVSCNKSEDVGFLRVLELPAEATLTGVRYGIEFQGSLTQSASDGDGMRTARFEFTAPDEFAELCVDHSCGVFGASCGEVSFSGLAAEKLGAPISAFLPGGDVVAVERIKDKAQTRIVLNRGSSVYEYIIDSKSGLPLFVTESNAAGEKIMEITVEKYEIK